MSERQVSRGARSTAPRIVTRAIVGGVLVCVGTALPWMTFFAGLQTLSGLVGLYGRILFASGTLAVVGGAAMFRLCSSWMKLAMAILGIVQTVFVLWLLRGLRLTIEGLGMHSMVVARPGAGLFVALAGTLLIASSILPLTVDHPGPSSARDPLLSS